MPGRNGLLLVIPASLVVLVLGIGPLPAAGRPLPPVGQAGPISQAVGQPVCDWFPINTEGEDQVASAAAFNSQRGEYMVVWYNDRPGNDDIYCQRVSADGTLIGSRVSIAAVLGVERRHPDVAYNSKQDEYLVVWEHDAGGTTRPNIHGRLVSATGLPQGSELTLGTGAALSIRDEPAVAYASTSDNYLVVWTSFVWFGGPDNIEGQIVSGQGALVGNNFYIAKAVSPLNHDQPDVAYNRSRNEFLVVWRYKDGDYDVYGRRVQGNGTPMQPPAIAIGRWTKDEQAPAVAAIPTSPNHGHYLVVWELRYTANDGDIYARPLAGNGTLSTTVVISSSTVEQFTPAVAGNEDSQEYLVAWTQPWGAVTGVRGRQVSNNGVLLGGEAWIGGDNADRAALATGPPAEFLVAMDALPVPSTGRDIYGRLWGDRACAYLYLPVMARDAQ